MLERDLIPMEDRNLGASVECFRSTIHIEVVRHNVDFASLKDNRVALDPPNTSFSHDVLDRAQGLHFENRDRGAAICRWPYSPIDA